MIKLQNLKPEPLFEQGIPVESDIWNTIITFKKGRNYLVTAPSGKGKSTFLHIIYGLRKDFSGALLLNEKDTSTFLPDQWSELRQKQFSIIFQEQRLFSNLTALANIQLNANLAVELSTTTLSHANSKVIRAINSVPSFSSNPYLQRTTVLDEYSPSSTTRRRALTNCPNNTTTDSGTPSYMKSVNPQSQADFLYFYVRQSYNPDEVYYNIYEVYGKTYNKDGSSGLDFVLGSNWKNQLGTTHICSDISHNFQKENTSTFSEYQSQIAVQNVAPGYINAHAYAPQESNYPYVTARTPITSSTSHYCLWVRGLYAGTPWVENNHSSVYWYSINREDASDTNNKELFQNVTFHWLNTVGGIDTYTARRDILESITSNKSLMETKLPNRRYMQDDADTSGALVVGDYYSDTMRGFDTYKGGSEVLNVNAKLKNSAYTEPLSYVESNWLREIFQSPNVWIEERTDFDNQVNFGTDAPYHMKSMNPYLRPESIIYKPVIITNSEVVSLDQEKGLVMYNIEYTISQGVLTQRN